MARICVIMTGLCALIRPNRRNRRGTIFLRRVDADVDVEKFRIPRHRALLRFFTGAGAQDRTLNGETISFKPSQEGEQCVVQGQELFLPIGLTAGAFPRVREDCLNGRAPCQGLISGRVDLSGGTISPIELEDVLDLGQLDRDISSRFAAATNLASGDDFRRRDPRLAANGLLWEKEIGDRVPSIRINQNVTELAATDPADLGGLGGNDPCFVVWIVNTSVGPNINPPAFDPDFHLLYDFVQHNGPRLVPVVVDPDQGPGDPPGRCIPGIASS